MAAYVERHHEILRVALHHADSQLAEDNIKVEFPMLLAPCVMAKNAMLNTGNGTPYNALYGRTPNMLPQVTDVTGAAHLDDEGGPEGSRHVHRVREVAV